MDNNAEILKLVQEKGSATIEAFEHSKNVFQKIKDILQKTETELKSKVGAADPRIVVEYNDKGRLEVHFRFANDVLIFMMHTCIFSFEPSHRISKTSYVKEGPLREFCGMIYVYNFLADSIKYNRTNDLGLLIARIFINKENHFFVDGKKRIGLLFNDFGKDEVSDEKLQKLIEALMLHVLENDVTVPPFEAMQQTTLQEIMDSSSHSGFITGKRFGFVLPGSGDDV